MIGMKDNILETEAVAAMLSGEQDKVLKEVIASEGQGYQAVSLLGRGAHPKYLVIKNEEW